MLSSGSKITLYVKLKKIHVITIAISRAFWYTASEMTKIVMGKRVYMRDRAGNTDFERPLVLKDGATVKEVCRKISREMMDSFRYAMLTSHSSKINEMRVGMDYPLSDEDIVTIISRN